MSDGAKCDFCEEPAVAVTGETNGLLVCIRHLDDELPFDERVRNGL